MIYRIVSGQTFRNICDVNIAYAPSAHLYIINYEYYRQDFMSNWNKKNIEYSYLI